MNINDSLRLIQYIEAAPKRMTKSVLRELAEIVKIKMQLLRGEPASP